MVRKDGVPTQQAPGPAREGWGRLKGIPRSLSHGTKGEIAVKTKQTIDTNTSLTELTPSELEIATGGRVRARRLRPIPRGRRDPF